MVFDKKTMMFFSQIEHVTIGGITGYSAISAMAVVMAIAVMAMAIAVMAMAAAMVIVAMAMAVTATATAAAAAETAAGGRHIPAVAATHCSKHRTFSSTQSKQQPQPCYGSIFAPFHDQALESWCRCL